jgi:threonine/homoserine/homoserine lactone efflux protein
MNRRLKLFGWTAAVSFAGSLPLGTLNLAVAHYASQQGALDALYFSIAAITVEAFFTRLAVRTIGQLEKQSRFFRFFDIGTTLLLLLLAGSHLAAAWRMQPFHTALAFTAAAQLRKQGKRSQNYHTLPQGK